ncbi:hypothetical protein [Calothrix sp. PCC 7507]|uniref:hypothetical protein n=1 Tax=Calothrix sp. PCC 7507 TaxID=99598 RepID=UPI00029ECDBF|nr:hypothetical protein [Calothrix sp. PCC 7507]AFY30693.1 hypothetical protein Cal7507_0191 [Calothrix sp. PCC 7507]
MGEAKRRKQLLGDAYGSQVTLEKCPIPTKISFGYVSDEALASSKAKLHKMSDDFKSAFFNALIKAQDTQEPRIVFSEALKFSGRVGVEISLRDDIETFIKSRCNNQLLALRIIQRLLGVDYITYRVIAFLDGSDIPKLAINVYSLEQIATLLQYLNEDISTKM